MDSVTRKKCIDVITDNLRGSKNIRYNLLKENLRVSDIMSMNDEDINILSNVFDSIFSPVFEEKDMAEVIQQNKEKMWTPYCYFVVGDKSLLEYMQDGDMLEKIKNKQDRAETYIKVYILKLLEEPSVKMGLDFYQFDNEKNAYEVNTLPIEDRMAKLNLIRKYDLIMDIINMALPTDEKKKKYGMLLEVIEKLNKALESYYEVDEHGKLAPYDSSDLEKYKEKYEEAITVCKDIEIIKDEVLKGIHIGQVSRSMKMCLEEDLQILNEIDITSEGKYYKDVILKMHEGSSEEADDENSEDAIEEDDLDLNYSSRIADVITDAEMVSLYKEDAEKMYESVNAVYHVMTSKEKMRAFNKAAKTVSDDAKMLEKKILNGKSIYKRDVEIAIYKICKLLDKAMGYEKYKENQIIKQHRQKKEIEKSRLEAVKYVNQISTILLSRLEEVLERKEVELRPEQVLFELLGETMFTLKMQRRSPDQKEFRDTIAELIYLNSVKSHIVTLKKNGKLVNALMNKEIVNQVKKLSENMEFQNMVLRNKPETMAKLAMENKGWKLLEV